MKQEASEFKRKYESQIKINGKLNEENILLKEQHDDTATGLRNALTAANENLKKQK